MMQDHAASGTSYTPEKQHSINTADAADFFGQFASFHSTPDVEMVSQSANPAEETNEETKDVMDRG